MATSSQLPKLLVYSAVSSRSPRGAVVKQGAGFPLSPAPGGGARGSSAEGELRCLTA